MPQACANQNYCEYKHELYPEKTIKNLLKNMVRRHNARKIILVTFT